MNIGVSSENLSEVNKSRRHQYRRRSISEHKMPSEDLENLDKMADEIIKFVLCCKKNFEEFFFESGKIGILKLGKFQRF